MATQYPNPIDLSALGDDGARFTYSGGDWLITAVSDAGDVNGDGFGDMIVSARAGTFNNVPLTNFVLYGSADGIRDGFDLTNLTPDQGFRIEGTSTIRAWMGQAAGDLNGDGFADIVVASTNDRVFDYAYEDINIILGGSGIASTVSLGALDGTNGFSLQTTLNYNWQQFEGTGDVNGDGIDDLVLGQQYDARAFYGSTSAQPAASQLADVTTPVFRPTDWYSGATSVIGDINGDGIDDMRFGEAIVFGTDAGFDPDLTVDDLDGTNGFRMGATSGTYAFRQVVSAGDVNGDGIDDFLIGSPYSMAHGHIEAGAAYVVFGRTDGFDPVFDVSTLDGSKGFAIYGETKWGLGADVAGAGDVNGDGFDDVVVGANSGDAFVVFGQATFHGAAFDADELDGTHGFRITNSHVFDGITDVSGIGDFNGDGFSDLGFATREGGENGEDIARGAVVYGQAPTGPVTLVDSAADQTLRGGAFDDVIISYGGDDRLIGGGGDDSLRSIEGTDTMEGGLGNDEYFVFADHSDIIVDTGGIDTIRTTTHWDLTGNEDIENVVLSAAGNWHLRGNDLDNRLVGSFGDNVLEGGNGNDRLEGGAGADILIGGRGRDVLIGGTGIDQFRLLETGDSDIDGNLRDVIVGYEAGELLNLGGVDANAHRNGNQAFSFIGDDEFTGRTGQLRYDTLTYSNGTVTTVVEGDVNGDGEADFAFEVRGAHTFTAADFIL